MTAQESMVSFWEARISEFGDYAVHPLYAEAFMAGWEKCREECIAAVSAEKLCDGLADATDIAYDIAISHAIEAIKNV